MTTILLPSVVHSDMLDYMGQYFNYLTHRKRASYHADLYMCTLEGSVQLHTLYFRSFLPRNVSISFGIKTSVYHVHTFYGTLETAMPF